jgi:hypothetical protein
MCMLGSSNKAMQCARVLKDGSTVEVDDCEGTSVERPKFRPTVHKLNYMEVRVAMHSLDELHTLAKMACSSITFPLTPRLLKLTIA